LGEKAWLKKADSHLGDDIRLRKKIERTWAWKKVLLKKGEIRTWAMTSV